MKKFIDKLNPEQRIVFYSSFVAISIFILLCPLFFFDLGDVPLGWLYGNLGGLIAFLMLVKQMDTISKKRSSRVAIIYSYSRYVVYATVLALPLVLSHYDLNILNIYLVFLGMLTHKVVIFTKRSG